jgi:rhomboid protease GluP
MNTETNVAWEAPPTPVWLRLPLHRPRVTPILLALLVLVWGGMTLYGYQRGLGFSGTEDLNLLIQFGAKVNDLIVAGEYWRLLSATFLHIGLLHLLLNGWALYLFGPMIERYYGAGRFVVIYLVAGLGGSIASFAFGPQVSAGASGAIFGLVGALAAFFWLHRRITGAEGRAQLLNAIFIVGINTVFGLSQSQAIDNWGHIGGLIGGAIAGLALAPRYRPGRFLAPDERVLADAIPNWGVLAISLALFGGTIFSFVLALLAYQS